MRAQLSIFSCSGVCERAKDSPCVLAAIVSVCPVGSGIAGTTVVADAVLQRGGFAGGELVVEEEDCIAIFHSIHRVMQAEKILLEQHLEVLLIPVPRSLSADCGMAIRFAHNQLESVQSVLQGTAMELPEIWLRRHGRYLRLQ